MDPRLVPYLVVGVVASLLGSMSGLGGGFLAVPVLYHLGVPAQYTVAASKFMVFATSVVSTYQYSRKLKLPLNLYVSVAGPMVLTAYFGAYLVAALPSNILDLALGAILLAIAVRMVTRREGSATSRGGVGCSTPRSYTLGVLSGSLAGLVAGISGLGGGVVNVPIFMYLLRLDARLAVPLSMACMIPSALSSVVRHLVDELVDWSIAIPLSAGAIVGGLIGPKVALRVRREALRKIVGAVILVATARIVATALVELL